MKNEDIDNLFDVPKESFDIFEPQEDHELRFLQKLSKHNSVEEETPVVSLTRKKNKWTTLLYIAATIAILIAVIPSGLFNTNFEEAELASVSPQLQETQDFFTVAINQQLEQINTINSEETKKVVEDALVQLQKLEVNYASLKKDLITSGYDKRVISAMIDNFQQRTLLLEHTLDAMNNIKKLKLDQNENNIL
ncbi:hypothetical protein [Aquimarina rhabdastrellae]